jgi:hypothetical protein
MVVVYLLMRTRRPTFFARTQREHLEPEQRHAMAGMSP